MNIEELRQEYEEEKARFHNTANEYGYATAIKQHGASIMYTEMLYEIAKDGQQMDPEALRARLEQNRTYIINQMEHWRLRMFVTISGLRAINDALEEMET